MPDRITTYDAAIEEMLRWANGEQTFRHEMLMLTEAPDLTPSELALCALADSAEVRMWVSVAGLLRNAPLDVEWPDGAGGEERELLKRCAEVIWKHEARACDMMALADHATIGKLAEDLRTSLFP